MFLVIDSMHFIHIEMYITHITSGVDQDELGLSTDDTFVDSV